jgi:hypothetical protein
VGVPCLRCALGVQRVLLGLIAGGKALTHLAGQPEVSIVIFDSQVPIGTGRGVYMSASAEELTGGERERGIEVFSRRSSEHGGDPWTLEDVKSPARLRLYRRRRRRTMCSTRTTSACR